MIIGIGCDICDIRRIEKLIEGHGEQFITRVYTASERERLQKRTNSASGFAKVFAGKEALVKALGDSTSLSWQDIEIVKNSHGRPEFLLHRKAHEAAMTLASGPYKLHLSLSDEPPYALAYAVFCKAS